MRALLPALALATLVLSILAAVASAAEPGTSAIERLQEDLVAGRTTSVALVRSSLARIDSIDRSGPQLRSVLSLNPNALEQAEQLDRERRRRGARGPLHGIPILLKDNVASADPLPTTAGSLALVENFASEDAPVVASLRAAGAIILGKANLSEWANFRSTHSISGWSAVGGLTRNPYVLDRSACGSSAGSAVAVAADLAVASIGTETDGSIVCPAAMNGVVGLKPTLGLLSGEGIVPIAHSQDTAGPIGRSVADVAILLTAMSDGPAACKARVRECRIDGYRAALRTASLAGKRIGVLRFAPGRWPQIDPVYAIALDHLRAAGATLIEAELPPEAPIDAAERIVLRTEFRVDLNEYLAGTPRAVRTRDLAQLIAFNRAEEREHALFGQELFELSEATKGLQDGIYLAALATSKRLARDGIDGLLQTHRLDLLVAPTTGPAWRIDTVNGDQFPGSFSTFPAVAGYPHLTVPMGNLRGLPLGISFLGPAWSEAAVLSAGFVFETRAGGYRAPKFIQSLETGPAAAPAGSGSPTGDQATAGVRSSVSPDPRGIVLVRSVQ